MALWHLTFSLTPAPFSSRPQNAPPLVCLRDFSNAVPCGARHTPARHSDPFWWVPTQRTRSQRVTGAPLVLGFCLGPGPRTASPPRSLLTPSSCSHRGVGPSESSWCRTPHPSAGQTQTQTLRGCGLSLPQRLLQDQQGGRDGAGKGVSEGRGGTQRAESTGDTEREVGMRSEPASAGPGRHGHWQAKGGISRG